MYIARSLASDKESFCSVLSLSAPRTHHHTFIIRYNGASATFDSFETGTLPIDTRRVALLPSPANALARGITARTNARREARARALAQWEFLDLARGFVPGTRKPLRTRESTGNRTMPSKSTWRPRFTR